MLYLAMKNKEEFLKALHGLEKYTNATSKLIETILKIESDYKVTGSIEYLMKATGLTKPTVYTSIRILKKDNFIIKNNEYRNTYDINPLKIDEIINQYKQNQSIIFS